MEVVFEIYFISFSNWDSEFDTKKLILRLYTIAKAMLIAKIVELINKREFVEAVLEKNASNFVVHVAALEVLESAMSVYFL